MDWQRSQVKAAPDRRCLYCLYPLAGEQKLCPECGERSGILLRLFLWRKELRSCTQNHWNGQAHTRCRADRIRIAACSLMLAAVIVGAAEYVLFEQMLYESISESTALLLSTAATLIGISRLEWELYRCLPACLEYSSVASAIRVLMRSPALRRPAGIALSLICLPFVAAMVIRATAFMVDSSGCGMALRSILDMTEAWWMIQVPIVLASVYRIIKDIHPNSRYL